MTARPQRADAWFVRVRQDTRYNIKPCTRQGWAVTIAYVLFSLALTPVSIPPEPVRVAAWLILFLAATALFVIVAWRTSSPAVNDGKADQKDTAMLLAPTVRRAHLPALLAIAGAALLVGIALALFQ